MVIDPLFIAYIAGGVSLLLFIWIIRLEMKLRKFMSGKSAKSLEDTIILMKKEITDLKRFEEESISYFKNVEMRLHRSIQGIKTIRFNPFKGTGDGGNQSFATSFIDESGDGVVISSLHSRDRVSIFSKPLEKFKSNFELTDEEKEVIEESKRTIGSK
ncbi:MAG: DUF4446 family protein [Candidatus Paceibacterota bacterium]